MKQTLKTLLAAFTCGLCAQATAEFWGFVDENGVARLASHQVDQRYYLFGKSPPRVLAHYEYYRARPPFAGAPDT